MVDNSQGHAAYASDTRLVTKMNLNPGGAVPNSRMAGSMRDGCRISQPMVFPTDHPTNADPTKGIKQVLNERGLWRQGLHLDCKSPKICSLTQLTAVHEGFFLSSLISWNRNPVSRKSLKQLGTCASSCQSFTANSTSLSFLGCSEEISAGALRLYI